MALVVTNAPMIISVLILGFANLFKAINITGLRCVKA